MPAASSRLQLRDHSSELQCVFKSMPAMQSCGDAAAGVDALATLSTCGMVPLSKCRLGDSMKQRSLLLSALMAAALCGGAYAQNAGTDAGTSTGANAGSTSDSGSTGNGPVPAARSS